jgi:hypothetical protein
MTKLGVIAGRSLGAPAYFCYRKNTNQGTTSVIPGTSASGLASTCRLAS